MTLDQTPAARLEIRKLIRAAYMAGFMGSGEGHNGETIRDAGKRSEVSRELVTKTAQYARSVCP